MEIECVINKCKENVNNSLFLHNMIMGDGWWLFIRIDI